MLILQIAVIGCKANEVEHRPNAKEVEIDVIKNLIIRWNNRESCSQSGSSTVGTLLNFSSNDVAGFTDGLSAQARFNYPYGVTAVGNNLFITDRLNSSIRQLDLTTGEVTTLSSWRGGWPFGVGGGGYILPFGDGHLAGIASDGENLYVADSSDYTIKKVVIATGEMTRLAGKPNSSYDSWYYYGSRNIDGFGEEALFFAPTGIAYDSGNLYVADSYNKTIRKVVIATGEVTTFAGQPSTAGSTDGVGSAATFRFPTGIVSLNGNLYVADSYGSNIRKIVIATGEVTTLAGQAGVSGTVDGSGLAALFHWPVGIASDGVNLYVSEGGSHTVRKVVIATGVVTTLAGQPGAFTNRDGVGADARFIAPAGIAYHGTRLYIADAENHSIRQLDPATANVTTIAGATVDRAPNTWFGHMNVYMIAADDSNLYLNGKYGVEILKYNLITGEMSTLAGLAGIRGYAEGVGAVARFGGLSGIFRDQDNLYVADSGNHLVRKVALATGEVTTQAGQAGVWGDTDGDSSTALFRGPADITSDGVNIFVSEYTSSSYAMKIRRLELATGVVSTMATGSLTYLSAFWNSGNSLFYSNERTIKHYNLTTTETSHVAGRNVIPTSSVDGAGEIAEFNEIRGIVSDGTSLFVADSYNHTIRRIDIASNYTTTLAGRACNSGWVDGTGSSVRFYYPGRMALNGSTLYVIDQHRSMIRVVSTVGP